jgi:hypothetical protein
VHQRKRPLVSRAVRQGTRRLAGETRHPPGCPGFGLREATSRIARSLSSLQRLAAQAVCASHPSSVQAFFTRRSSAASCATSRLLFCPQTVPRLAAAGSLSAGSVPRALSAGSVPRALSAGSASRALSAGSASRALSAGSASRALSAGSASRALSAGSASRDRRSGVATASLALPRVAGEFAKKWAGAVLRAVLIISHP